MDINLLQTFLLVDAFKRLMGAQFKGARSRAKSIAEYDAARQTLLDNSPGDFDNFCKLFGIDPKYTGNDFFGAAK